MCLERVSVPWRTACSNLCADLCDVKYCSSCNFSFGFRTDILRYHSLVGLAMPFNVPRKSNNMLASEFLAS